MRLRCVDLGNPERLPLTRDHIQRLSKDWTNSDLWRGAWSDIEVLTQRFIANQGSNSDVGHLAWHHLLLAVGNYKRSAGTIFPLQLPCAIIAEAPGTFTFVSSSGQPRHVECEQSSSWTSLTREPGIGVPTATTLLSAIWPSRHVIIDIRDVRASIGLSIDALLRTPDLNSANIPNLGSWEFYAAWFRPVVLATAKAESCAPVDVERALYVLDRRVLARLPKRWTEDGTWSQYYRVADEIISYV